MKTNQIMVRPMGDFEIIQRTCDGKFDCTNLLAPVSYTHLTLPTKLEV